MPYFPDVDRVRYEGPDSDSPLAFRHYDADRLVLGKPMREHLRMAACYWHTFVWPGADMFGVGTFKRPWQGSGDPMELAIGKAEAAFEFFSKLGIDYYSFHDTDVAPEGTSLKEYRHNFALMVDHLERHQQQSGIKLLWGTANCFSNPRRRRRCQQPDPEVFAYAATQVFSAMNATQRLKGSNYVLWGGREGYETLLNTDLKREREQLGRFMRMVVEHKHKIGFKGDLLIEPKPQEPTKHQYDYDSATVFGFLQQYGLENEIKVNIEANHATLAGHSFHHEIATAVSLGIFGSIDANRGDPQNGWDTDQFPNSVEEMTSPPTKSSRLAASPTAVSISTPRCVARASTISTCFTATSPRWMSSPWRWSVPRPWCRTINSSTSRTSATQAGSSHLANRYWRANSALRRSPNTPSPTS